MIGCLSILLLIRNMISNLDKGLRRSRDFSLKSCIRIRGTMQYKQLPNCILSTLRFEATMLDMSFTAVQINAIPILHTALSQYLASRDISINRERLDYGNNNVESGSGPVMGYLTMNQTRKLIPMLETDNPSSSAMTSPVVGAWVSIDLPSIDHIHSLETTYAEDVLSPTAMLTNPLVWGACARYVMNANVQERIWVDEDKKTFLLVSDMLKLVYNFHFTYSTM